MQIHQLRYFLAVAETRHFTRAADLCDVAQPSLSKQVRALENDLGTQLFVRERGAVALTASGEALLPHARQVLIHVDAARRAVDEVAGLRRGRIRLGATPSLCAGLLADALRRFHGSFPSIELQVHEGGSRDLTRSLSRGELDMALLIVPLRSGEPATDDIVTTPILREGLVLASRPGDEPGPGTLSVEDLRDVPLVMFREGYDLRETTFASCREAGFEPTLAVEGGEMDAVLRFVEAGLGSAVVPGMVMRTRPGLHGSLLDGERFHRTIALAHRRRDLPRTAQEFIRELVDHLAGAGRDELGADIEVLVDPADASVRSSR